MTDPYLTPQEFGLLIDLAGRSPATIGDGYKLNEALSRAIALANQPNRIVAAPPEVSVAQGVAMTPRGTSPLPSRFKRRSPVTLEAYDHEDVAQNAVPGFDPPAPTEHVGRAPL